MKKPCKSKIFLVISSIFTLFTLASCSLKISFGDKDNENNNDDNNGGNIVQPSDDVESLKTKFDMSHVANKTNDVSVTPSKGNVNILVVPIEFRDKTAYTSSQLNAINASFNGTKEDGSNDYWESLASFYKKSSYGKLNFSFDICDPYTPSITATRFINITDDYATETTTLLKELNSSAPTINGQSVNFSSSKYDSDNDGYVDGIWLIYNEANANNVDSSHYWAYTNYLNFDNSIGKFSTYANCALSFLYDDSKIGHDAHTLIHETGHMLGIDDYYSYALSSKFGYTGGIDMMDLNIGDHDSFTKWQLDWIEPYVAYNKETTVELDPLESLGKAIVIPTDTFNNSAFSEYLILEYYTPTGLNELDMKNAYCGYYPKNFLKPGLRVWHVDSRICKIDAKLLQNGSITYTTNSYLNPSATSVPEYKQTSNTTASYYAIANSNTPEYNYVNEDYALIELVSKSRKTIYGATKAANDSDLLHAGDTLDFSARKSSFNDGTSSKIKISVNSLTDEKISVTIVK